MLRFLADDGVFINPVIPPAFRQMTVLSEPVLWLLILTNSLILRLKSLKK